MPPKQKIKIKDFFKFISKILKSIIGINAKDNIKNDNVIGMPTETVYGLAGNAYSDTAVKKIYKLKIC